MKVILLQDVSSVGQQGDVKEVKDGYAQNFLIPRKLAETATEKIAAEVQAKQRRRVVGQKAAEQEIARTLLDLNGKVVTLSVKANDEGNLFAQVHERDIAKAIHGQHNVALEPTFIQLTESIKKVGSHDVVLEGGGVSAVCILTVEPA